MQYFCELIAKKKETKQSKQTPTRNVSQFTTFYYQLHLERLSFFHCIGTEWERYMFCSHNVHEEQTRTLI